MELTNERMVNDAGLLGALSHKALPVKVSYAIAKNISKIENELKVYNEERQKLLNKYAEKNEKDEIIMNEDNSLKIAKEHIDDWNKDIKELLDIKVEIDIHKFKFDDLVNSNCELTPADLMVLDYMIEE